MERENFKQKIGIVADEGGDLPEELIKISIAFKVDLGETHNISIVPFKVDLGEMKDLAGNIYQRIREAEKRGLKALLKLPSLRQGIF